MISYFFDNCMKTSMVSYKLTLLFVLSFLFLVDKATCNATNIEIKIGVIMLNIDSSFGSDTIPRYIGGDEAFSRLVQKHSHIPISENGFYIEGKAIVAFNVDTTGHIDSIRLIHSDHPFIADEVIKVIKASDGNWISGIKNDKKVRMSLSLPINFDCDFNANELALDGKEVTSFFFEKGVGYFECGQLDKAFEMFSIVLKYNPKDVDALYNCAAIKINQNSMDEACVFLTQMKKMKKNDPLQQYQEFCVDK